MASEHSSACDNIQWTIFIRTMAGDSVPLVMLGGAKATVAQVKQAFAATGTIRVFDVQRIALCLPPTDHAASDAAAVEQSAPCEQISSLSISSTDATLSPSSSAAAAAASDNDTPSLSDELTLGACGLRDGGSLELLMQEATVQTRTVRDQALLEFIAEDAERWDCRSGEENAVSASNSAAVSSASTESIGAKWASRYRALCSADRDSLHRKAWYNDLYLNTPRLYWHHDDASRKTHYVFGDAGAAVIAQALADHECAAAVRLDMSNNWLTEDGAVAIFKLLHWNLSPAELVLSHNKFGDSGVTALARALPGCHTLRHLELAHVGATWRSGSALADGLQQNTSLQHLDLKDNLIGHGNGGIQAIADALRMNATLTHLDLEGNGIKEDEGVAFADSLRFTGTLQHLNLARNSLGDLAAARIGHAIGASFTLRHVDLRANDIDAQGAIAIAKGLAISVSLEHLDLGGNVHIGGKGATAIGKALKTNASLQWLSVAGTNCGHQGCVALAEGLTVNAAGAASLRFVDVSDNGIGKRGTDLLAKCQKLNPNLYARLVKFGDEAGASAAAGGRCP